MPILFFTSGTHPDYHQPTDSADRIDAAKAARLVQLLYHLVVEIGNDPDAASLVAGAVPGNRPGTLIRKVQMRRRLLTAGLLAAAAPLVAQTTAPDAGAAAATISASDVARRIGVIADDSMLGRDTPSNGLELTAKYVADQFKSFGLTPGGEDGTWFQRYPITRRRLELDSSRIVFRVKSAIGDTARFTRTARYAQGAVPESPVSGPAILVGGRLSPEDSRGDARSRARWCSTSPTTRRRFR